MCITLGGGNPQINQPEKANSSAVEKSNINSNINKENNEAQQTESGSASTLEGDSVEVEHSYKDSGHTPTIISFDNTEPTNSSEEITEMNTNDPQEMKIAEFISSMNDKTMQAILDAFDRMLESSRRMMEENKRFFEKVTQPKQEALKKIVMKEDLIEKEAMKQIQNGNI